MPRQPPGLNTVTKRRPDGTVVRYYYDRTSGLFLGHDKDAALAKLGAPPAPKEIPGSLSALITEYRDTPEFKRLRPGTRKLYIRYLDQMKTAWGDLAIRGIDEGVIQDIKVQHQATPSKANMILALFRNLLGLALLKRYVKTNAALRPKRLPPPKRIEIWSHDLEDEFVALARDSLKLGFMLMLYTLQRPNDCLDMTKGRVSERGGRLYIALRQAKTGELLEVPVHRRLEPLIRARLDSADAPLLLVPSPTGRRWAYRNFARAWDLVIARMNERVSADLLAKGWDKDAVAAEVAARHRQRRDLRRTGVVRLAEAGATTPQIAAVSGHSIDYCQKIIDTYLPRRTEVALGGMEAWERHTGRGSSTVVRLSSSRRNSE
jgi:integrase